MQSTDKARLTALISPDLDKRFRLFAVHQDKNLSEVVEAMIHHCIDNPQFIEKLTKKEAITC